VTTLKDTHKPCYYKIFGAWPELVAIYSNTRVIVTEKAFAIGETEVSDRACLGFLRKNLHGTMIAEGFLRDDVTH
jgi:hypothetical protein